MKSKEEQEDFNMKLMKILDIIEKKKDKESGSNKSGSHETPEKKGRSKSGRGHHHHYKNHSHRISHSISSPSLAIKHRRYGVDDLKGEMNKIKPHTFDGKN